MVAAAAVAANVIPVPAGVYPVLRHGAGINSRGDPVLCFPPRGQSASVIPTHVESQKKRMVVAVATNVIPAQAGFQKWMVVAATAVTANVIPAKAGIQFPSPSEEDIEQGSGWVGVFRF